MSLTIEVSIGIPVAGIENAGDGENDIFRDLNEIGWHTFAVTVQFQLRMRRQFEQLLPVTLPKTMPLALVLRRERTVDWRPAAISKSSAKLGFSRCSGDLDLTTIP